MTKYREIDDSNWPKVINHNVFVTLLKHHFPEVYSKIDYASAGLLHCEMGVFLQESLSLYSNREKLTRTHFDFANKILKRADSDVLNALTVSYIEGFVLGSKDEQTAREWMPEDLKELYDDFQEYYTELVKFSLERRNKK